MIPILCRAEKPAAGRRRQSARLLGLAAAVGALVFVSGCARRVAPTGFIGGYANLVHVEDVDFWVARDVTAARPMTLDFEAKPTPDPTPPPAYDFGTTPALVAINGRAWADRHVAAPDPLAVSVEDHLEELCYKAALAHYPPPTIVTWEETIGDYPLDLSPIARLETTVSEVDPGHGWMRYFIGYYAGAAALQAEFRLREARTNRLIAVFATRRLHAGDPNMGMNPMAFSAKYCLKKAAESVARDAVIVMDRILRGEDLNAPRPGKD